MVKFQIASDLHIDFRNDKVPDPADLIVPKADILVLSGDIGSLYKFSQLKQFMSKLCKLFQKVFYILGNHEFYMVKGYNPLSIGKLMERIYELEQSIENLYLLNRSAVEIDGVCIAGCTLWSDLKIKVPRYRVRIYGITDRIYTNKYQGDLKYIKDIIEYCQHHDLKLVLVTHYAPSLALLDESKNNEFRSLYASSLDYLFDRTIVHTWVYGHVHYNCDLISEGGTRIVGNQKGKSNENTVGYSKTFVLEV